MLVFARVLAIMIGVTTVLSAEVAIACNFQLTCLAISRCMHDGAPGRDFDRKRIGSGEGSAIEAGSHACYNDMNQYELPRPNPPRPTWDTISGGCTNAHYVEMAKNVISNGLTSDNYCRTLPTK